MLRTILFTDPWFSDESGLDIQRVCDAVGSSIFVASLWVGDAECALCEHMGRLNTVKIHIDLFVENYGEGLKEVSFEALHIWNYISANGKKYVDVENLIKEFEFLGQILYFSNPLKLRDALALCNGCLSLQRGVCRLYSDELDTAVGFISQQIELVKRRVEEDVFLSA